MGQTLKINKFNVLKKFIALLLFFFLSKSSFALSDDSLMESYNKYLGDGNFEGVMELAEYIISEKDKSNLKSSDYQILVTAFGYYHQFSYVLPEDKWKSFNDFFSIDGSSKDALYISWYMHFYDVKKNDFLPYLENIDFVSKKDVGGSFSYALLDYMNWRLGTLYSDDERFVDAELRALNSMSVGSMGMVFPWDAALYLSRMSRLYNMMGRNKLAAITAENAIKIFSKLPEIPHLYLAEIIANLSIVSALNGSFDLSELLLSMLSVRDTRKPKYINQSAELTIATSYLYLSMVKADLDLLNEAKKRFNSSKWTFNKLSVDVLFESLEQYISIQKTNDCTGLKPYLKKDSGQESMDNLLLGMELDVRTLCGDFDTAEVVLKKMVENAHASVNASTKGLTMSLEPYFHSNWSEEQILKSIVRFENSNNGLSIENVENVIELFFKLESSPAEREIAVLEKAVSEGSLKKINATRKYFNLLREREDYLNKFYQVYTERVLKWAELNFPLHAGFKDFHTIQDKRILDEREKINDILSYDKNDNIEKIRKNLRASQAALFSLKRGNYGLVCLISKNETLCEPQEQFAKLEKSFKNIQGAVRKGNLFDAKQDISNVSKVIFSPKVRKSVNLYDEIFFVPDKDAWRLPFNLIWDAAEIKAKMIICPTLSGLAIQDLTIDNTENKHLNSYVGVGNPQYGFDSVPAEGLITGLNGFTIRSPELSRKLADLNPLPGTESEILNSEKRFEGETMVFLGENASEEKLLKSNWSQSKIIHFATHALVSGEFKGLDEPAIALSSPDEKSFMDGLLTVTDIRGYTFPGSTIILSGCQTATDYGSSSKGGITGLSLAFLSGGARELLVTQWQIPDIYSSKVIDDFFQEFQQNDTLKSISSTLSKYKTLNIDPINWAAYVLVSLPSSYNKINDNTQKKNITSISTSGDILDTASSITINNETFIAISSTSLPPNRTGLFEIFQYKKDKSIERLFSYKGLWGSFIGPSDKRLIFFTSRKEKKISMLSDDMKSVKKEFTLVNSKEEQIVTHFDKAYVNGRIYFIYRTVKENTEPQIWLSSVSDNFEDFKKTNITSETTKGRDFLHYGGILKIIPQKKHLIFSLTNQVASPYRARGSNHLVDNFYKESTIYKLDFNHNVVSNFKLDGAEIISSVEGNENLLYAKIHPDRYLAVITTDGDVKYKNTDISDVIGVSEMLIDGVNMAVVVLGFTYSSDNYRTLGKFDLSDLVHYSLDRIPNKPKTITEVLNDAYAPIHHDKLLSLNYSYRTIFIDSNDEKLQPYIIYPASRINERPLLSFNNLESNVMLVARGDEELILIEKENN